jgi:hypothetical protein
MVQSSFFSKSSYRKTAHTLYLRAAMSYLVQVYIRESMLHADESRMRVGCTRTASKLVEEQ